MTTYLIYILTDPRNGDIRYVGKTCRPRARFSDHCNARNQRGRCLNWERTLQRLGLTCGIIIVSSGLTAEDAITSERRWITLGRTLGWPLTNLTDGGEGASGYRHPLEAREKFRAARLGKKLSPETIARRTASVLGSKRSEETRARMREAQRGHKPTEQCLILSRNANLGSKHTSEHVEKIRQALLGIKRSAETNAKHGLATRGRKRTQEQIDRIRSGALRGWMRRKGCEAVA